MSLGGCQTCLLASTFTKPPAKIIAASILISDALAFGRLWYTKPDDAVGYATHRSRPHDAVIRVYDDACTVIETREHKGDFQEW